MPNAYTESLLSKSKFPMMQVGRARLKRRKNGLWILQHNTTQPDKFANLWDSLALIRSVLIDVTQALFWLYSDASIDLLCKTEEDSIAVSIIVDVLQRLSWQYQKSRSKQLLQRQHSLAKQERGSAERWVSRSRRKKKEGIVGKEEEGPGYVSGWIGGLFVSSWGGGARPAAVELFYNCPATHLPTTLTLLLFIIIIINNY